jgi:hypothetical protein
MGGNSDATDIEMTGCGGNAQRTKTAFDHGQPVGGLEKFGPCQVRMCESSNWAGLWLGLQAVS